MLNQAQLAGSPIDQLADQLRLFAVLVQLGDGWSTLQADSHEVMRKHILGLALPAGDHSELQRILGKSLKLQFERIRLRDLAADAVHSELTLMAHQLQDDWTGYKPFERFIYVGSDTLRFGAPQAHVPFQGGLTSVSQLRQRVKIGQTSDPVTRESVYKSHNPDFRMWLVYRITLRGPQTNANYSLNALTRKQIQRVEREVHVAVENAGLADVVRRGEWFECTRVGGAFNTHAGLDRLRATVQQAIVAAEPGDGGHAVHGVNDVTDRLPLGFQIEPRWTPPGTPVLNP